MRTSHFEAEPYPLEFQRESTALLIIDMQRDFLESGGFGEMLGNDVSLLRSTIEPSKKVLAAARAAGLSVIHTREGHRPDLADAPPSKLSRGRLETGIGDPGPMGRVLVRGGGGAPGPAAGSPRNGVQRQRTPRRRDHAQAIRSRTRLAGHGAGLRHRDYQWRPPGLRECRATRGYRRGGGIGHRVATGDLPWSR